MQPIKTMMSMDELEAKKAELLIQSAQYLVQILAEHRVDVQATLDATSADQMWAHPPKPNWVVFPKCGSESRRVWDYDYPHEFSGNVYDMFPELQ